MLFGYWIINEANIKYIIKIVYLSRNNATLELKIFVKNNKNLRFITLKNF